MLEEEKPVGGLKKIILEMSKHPKISVWRVLDIIYMGQIPQDRENACFMSFFFYFF